MHATLPMPRYFSVCGQALALILMSMALFGFQPFYFGYWNAEPITLAMFAVSALSALWLGIGISLGWVRLTFARGNLLLYAWVGWIGWQAIGTVFAASPWRSWFGPPEQSEGLAWFICVGISMLQLSVLWHSERFRRLLIGHGYCLLFALALLHFMGDADNNIIAGLIFPHMPDELFASWVPFVWPDYLGAMAIWWWLGCMLTFPNLSLGKLTGICFGMFFILIASSNHGAMLIASYAMLITLIVRLMKARTRLFARVSTAWRVLAMAGLLFPILWLLATPFLPVNYKGDVSQSLPTRILMGHVSLHAVAEEPTRLLFGEGWGQYEDDFFKAGLIRDVRVYDEGKHRPNWDMIRGYNYHSHNMAAEALLSFGLLGMVLWLLLPMIAVRRLPDEHFWNIVPMLVASRVIAGLWFALPQSMPYQALSWFLLIRMQPSTGSRPLHKQACAAASLIVSAALAWSAWAQYDAIRYNMRMADPFGARTGHAVTAEYMKEDIRRGGDRLRTYFIALNKRMVANKQAVEEKHITLYSQYLDAMEALAADPRTGAYNASSLLYGYNALISNIRNPIYHGLQSRISAHYHEQALAHTRRAPQREDIIAPYLLAMVNMKDDDLLMALVQELLAINPGHRSALWVGGQVLSTKPGFEVQGKEMMKAALALGADRIYPIRTSDIEALNK